MGEVYLAGQFIRVVSTVPKKENKISSSFPSSPVRVFQLFQMHSLNWTDNWRKGGPNDLNMFTNISRLHTINKIKRTVNV